MNREERIAFLKDIIDIIEKRIESLNKKLSTVESKDKKHYKDLINSNIVMKGRINRELNEYK